MIKIPLLTSLLTGRRACAYRCNICGAANTARLETLGRENASCSGCGSSVRMRAVVHHVSMALFGASMPMPEFPSRSEVRGVGLSDWPVYARRLAAKLSYTNTFYHADPFLDITAVPPELVGTCDFVVSTDVFEHVLPPVSRAFAGAHSLLKPGGTLVLTVPYVLEHEFAREHFPDLHRFEIREAAGQHVLVNTRRDGSVERFEKLVFHGGPGSTLEMRMLHKDQVVQQLEQAGFRDIRFEPDAVPEFGIFWRHPWSLPITARA